MSDASLQHWREGVGAYNAGDIQRAIAQFKSAAPSKGVLFNLGVSTAKLGDNKTAIRPFDEVLRLDPNLGVAYLTRCASVSHARLSPLLRTPAVSVRAARFALVIAGAAL